MRIDLRSSIGRESCSLGHLANFISMRKRDGIANCGMRWERKKIANAVEIGFIVRIYKHFLFIWGQAVHLEIDMG